MLPTNLFKCNRSLEIQSEIFSFVFNFLGKCKQKKTTNQKGKHGETSEIGYKNNQYIQFSLTLSQLCLFSRFRGQLL